VDIGEEKRRGRREGNGRGSKGSTSMGKGEKGNKGMARTEVGEGRGGRQKRGEKPALPMKKSFSCPVL